jgi:hypothetical protein
MGNKVHNGFIFVMSDTGNNRKRELSDMVSQLIMIEAGQIELRPTPPIITTTSNMSSYG